MRFVLDYLGGDQSRYVPTFHSVQSERSYTFELWDVSSESCHTLERLKARAPTLLVVWSDGSFIFECLKRMLLRFEHLKRELPHFGLFKARTPTFHAV